MPMPKAVVAAMMLKVPERVRASSRGGIGGVVKVVWMAVRAESSRPAW